MKKTLFVPLVATVFAIPLGCHQESKPDFNSVGFKTSSRGSGGVPVPMNRLGQPAHMGGGGNDMTPVSPPGTAPTNASHTPAVGTPEHSTPMSGVSTPSLRGIQGGGPGFTQPKADESVTGVYRSSGGTSVEVEGVCKVSEDDIQCWKPDGSSNDALTDKIKAAIEKQQSYGGSMGMNLQYGKKNRLVVFKVSQPTNGKGGYVNIQSVGPNSYGGGFGVSLDEPRMFNNNQPVYVRYETRSVAEAKSATTTTAHLTEFIQSQEEPIIDNKVGAKATFEGESLTVLSVKKGADRPYMMGDSEDAKHPMWTLTLHSPPNGVHPVNVTLTPLNAEGKPIVYVDDKGNPLSDTDYRKAMDEYQEKMRTMYRQANGRPGPGMAYPHFGSAVIMTSRTADTVTVILRVDPAKIGKFAVHGGTSRLIDLTGIPLGPK